MATRLDNFERMIGFLRDVGILIGIPTLAVIALNMHELEVNTLKQEIDSLKGQSIILNLYQPDKVLSIIEAQKKLYEFEKENASEKINILDKKIKELKERGGQLQELREIIQNKDKTIENQKSIIQETDDKINTLRKQVKEILKIGLR